MSHIDVRGFVYSLEPVQRQREWRLEAALSRQRGVLTQLSNLGKSRDRFDHDIAELACRMREGALLDPVAHLRLLEYLSKLHHERDGLIVRIEESRAELRRSNDQVHVCQRNVDAIDEHRESNRAEYGVERSRRLQVQVDDEWTTRARYRTAEGEI